MNNSRILIVEDDLHISRLIQYNLEKSGFITICCQNGKTALEILAKEDINLVLLDVMLPELDGFEVCKTIRKNQKYDDIPIIMLTAKGEEIDRIMGFEYGADDYIVKPFSPNELVLRIKAILKRIQPKTAANKEQLVVDALVIDPVSHKVTVYNEEIVLTKMEFNLLYLLVARKGRVQSRKQLLTDVWDIAADITTRAIDTHITKLRKKLGNMGAYIETVHGFGYRFKDTE